jgi:hypothetical protein
MHEQTFTHHGLTVKIEHDEDAQDPRKDFDNFGTMACFHRRYTLGDKHGLTIAEVQAIAISGDYISLPIYMLDHSGYTISNTPFNDPWDSGRLGLIFVSKADVRKEFSVTRLSKSLCEKARKILRQETEIYDAYLTGQVYQYAIEDEDGTELDACAGYYCTDQASDEYLLKEAKQSAQHNAHELYKAQAQAFALTHTQGDTPA